MTITNSEAAVTVSGAVRWWGKSETILAPTGSALGACGEGTISIKLTNPTLICRIAFTGCTNNGTVSVIDISGTVHSIATGIDTSKTTITVKDGTMEGWDTGNFTPIMAMEVQINNDKIMSIFGVSILKVAELKAEEAVALDFSPVKLPMQFQQQKWWEGESPIKIEIVEK